MRAGCNDCSRRLRGRMDLRIFVTDDERAADLQKVSSAVLRSRARKWACGPCAKTAPQCGRRHLPEEVIRATVGDVD